MAGGVGGGGGQHRAGFVIFLGVGVELPAGNSRLELTLRRGSGFRAPPAKNYKTCAVLECGVFDT